MDGKKGPTDVQNVDDGSNEVHVLQQKNEELAREMKSRDEVITRLEGDLGLREKEISGLKESREGAMKKAEELVKTLAGTVKAYRELVVGVNPGIVGDLIQGNNIEEVNESLKKAQTLMERVRQGIEAEAGKTRIPAGAPVRAQPELSGLTAREKIRYGMGKVA